MPEWYALAVKPHKEMYVEKQLIQQGIRTANPRYKKVVRHARQVTHRMVALFPGYIFVELEIREQNWRLVNWTPGSIGLLKSNGRPSPLEKSFVNGFITSLDQNGLISLNHEYRIGDRVRAIGGPFDQLVGEVIEMDDKDRVKILMSALNRKIETTLPRSAVIFAA